MVDSEIPGGANTPWSLGTWSFHRDCWRLFFFASQLLRWNLAGFLLWNWGVCVCTCTLNITRPQEKKGWYVILLLMSLLCNDSSKLRYLLRYLTVRRILSAGFSGWVSRVKKAENSKDSKDSLATSQHAGEHPKLYIYILSKASLILWSFISWGGWVKHEVSPCDFCVCR